MEGVILWDSGLVIGRTIEEVSIVPDEVKMDSIGSVLADDDTINSVLREGNSVLPTNIMLLADTAVRFNTCGMKMRKYSQYSHLLSGLLRHYSVKWYVH